MIHIYMDESWDLWFENIWTKNSKYFTITFLMSDDKKDLELVMKNTYSWMSLKWIRIKESFFHSNKESIACVRKVLNLSSYRNIKIATLIFDKKKLPYSLKNEKHKLYNLMVWELLKICEQKWFLLHNDTIFFTASRRETKKELNNAFLEYIREITSYFRDFRLQIWIPRIEKWLEVVDAISFSVYKKYESNDSYLYDIIKDKIIFEKLLD